MLLVIRWRPEGVIRSAASPAVLATLTTEELPHVAQEKLLAAQVRHAEHVVFSVPSVHFARYGKVFGNERFLTLKQWQALLEPFEIEIEHEDLGRAGVLGGSEGHGAESLGERALEGFLELIGVADPRETDVDDGVVG